MDLEKRTFPIYKKIYILYVCYILKSKKQYDFNVRLNLHYIRPETCRKHRWSLQKSPQGLGISSSPHSVGQLLILDLRAEEVGVGGLVAHGGGERAEDGEQELKDLVLVDAVPAVSRRLAQRALHGHQQRRDVDKAAHLAEHRPGAVTLTQHR